MIPIARTGQNPEVEQVLGALSLLLNGGGVGQLQTITRELNKTLHGREGEATSVLHQIRSFSGQLDRHKQDIVQALDALNRLSGQLNHQRSTIDATLEQIPGALHSIDTQRHDLVRMLKALDHLSGVGVHVISLSKDATIDTLRQLSPVLSQLQASGSDFVNAFNVALTYPFVDEVVGRDPQVARNLQMGDYTDLSIKLDVSLDQNGSLPVPTGVPTALPTLPTDLPTSLPTSEITKILGDVAQCLRSGDISSHACQKVLADPQELLKLLAKCKKKKHQDNPVCQALDTLPTPSLPTGLPPLSLPTLLGNARRPRQRRPARRDARPSDPAARPCVSSRACTTPGWSACSCPEWWWVGDHASNQDPADDLRPDHAARGELRGRQVRPAEPAGLPHLLHRGRALLRLRRHVRRRLVSYRGVRVGQVQKLELTHDGVDAYLDIDKGWDDKIPAATLAVVGNRSAVGEQYVDLQPQTDRGPYLHDGSQIANATPAHRCRPRSCWATSPTPSRRFTAARCAPPSTRSARRSPAPGPTSSGSSTPARRSSRRPTGTST